MVKSHILKLPVPRMQLRTISRQDAAALLDSCTNLRDYLLLYSAGWEPEMLKRRAGHKNNYTTLDTYVHPSVEEVAKAFRKAAESLKMPSLGRESGQ